MKNNNDFKYWIDKYLEIKNKRDNNIFMCVGGMLMIITYIIDDYHSLDKEAALFISLFFAVISFLVYKIIISDVAAMESIKEKIGSKMDSEFFNNEKYIRNGINLFKVTLVYFNLIMILGHLLVVVFKK